MEKKQKQKNNQNTAITLCVIAIILLYTVIRVIIIRQTSMRGGAYFFSSYEMILFFILLFPMALAEVLNDQVKKRKELEQFRNAKHLYNSAMFMSIIYSLVLSLIFILAGKWIAGNILIGQFCSLSFQILVPVILFCSVSLIIRSYLSGVYSSTISVFSLLVKQVIVFIGVIVFSGLLTSYGKNAAAVLLNEETQYAFGASGASIGIVAGSLLGLVLCFVMMAGCKKELRKQIRRDPTKRKEDITGLFQFLLGLTMPVALGLFLLNSYQFIDQWMFASYMKKSTEAILLSYQWGAYAGIYKTALFLPLIMIFVITYQDKETLQIGNENGDQHEVRIKAQSMIKDSMMIVFLFAVFIGVMARPIVSGIFHVDSDLAVSLLRFGCIALIPMGYAISSVNVLAGTGNHLSNIINGSIALAVNILVMLYTLKVIKIGIYGVLVSFGFFALVFGILNCLSLMKILHYRFDWRKLIVLPLISGIISGVISLLLLLLFRLFMPSLLIVLIIFPIAFMIYFSGLAILGAITPYSVSSFPMGYYLCKLGKMFKIFR